MTPDTTPELPDPDFMPAPLTTDFAVVEDVAETITAVESVSAGPTASAALEQAAAEAAAEAHRTGEDTAPVADD